MLKGYQIIDADSHVVEPYELWEEYLEPAFKSYALSRDRKIAGEEITYKKPTVLTKESNDNIAEHYPMSVLNRFDPESQVRVMKQTGVDISFLYPTVGLWVFAIDSMKPQLAGAFIRAYNNWLRDFCSFDPELLRGAGAINLHGPEEMIPELHRIAEWGWKAVFLRPNPVKGRILSDPAYEAFWSECENLGIAVSIHEGTHSRLPTTGADRFNSRFAMHACSHPMEQMMAMLALIEGGVLERHPQLKVGFFESGCGWLPYWLWRLDEEFEQLYWEVKDRIKMKPSEYFCRQCYIGIEPSEPYLEEVVKYIGADNLLFGSDYPHMDHKPNIVKDAVALEERLSQETVRKILWDNPALFYGIETT